MPVASSVVLMGLAVAGGVASYSASKTQAKRAEAQGEIAARQGGRELKRSAQSAEEAMLELEDAREYQAWKEQYVTPVLNKSISDPRQSDASQLAAQQNLSRGIEIDQAQGDVARGISEAGFDVGGSRHSAADNELVRTAGSSSTATMGAAFESTKQQGISNTGSLVGAGRNVYKQQGII